MPKRRELWRFREQTARLICLVGPVLFVLGSVRLHFGPVGDSYVSYIVAERVAMIGVPLASIGFPVAIYWLWRVRSERKLRRLWILIVILGALYVVPFVAIYIYMLGI